MYKRILVLVLFLLTLNLSFGANVELNAHIYSEYTIFNYIFTFNENETADRFSFEKPKDSTVDYVVDKNGPIQYEIAGDYLILKPEEVRNNVFLLKLKTKSLSEEIVKTESFRTYQNFNFDVSIFNFKITLKEDYGEIIDVFPSNYSITSNDKIEWKQTSLGKNSLYVINFKKEEIVEETTGNYSIYYLGGISVISLLIILGLLFFIYPRYLKKYLKKEKIVVKDEENLTEKVLPHENKNKIVEEAKKLEKKQEEIIEKHLTENEKSVVQLVKTQEGISQNEILDYLPSLTKSNLSKIISKLHAKRILNRIRVGKVNNIYLGDKLTHKKSSEEKKQEEEEEY